MGEKELRPVERQIVDDDVQEGCRHLCCPSALVFGNGAVDMTPVALHAGRVAVLVLVSRHSGSASVSRPGAAGV